MTLRGLPTAAAAGLLCLLLALAPAQAADPPVVEGPVEDTTHAETGLPEHPVEDAAHAAVGMPQLEFGDYMPQLVWLAITFALLYVLMSRLALPQVARVMEERQQRVRSDLERAEQMKSQADDVLAVYQRAIADGRSRAQAEMKAAAAEIAATAAERDAEFAAAIAARTQEAERGIAEARSRAMADLRRAAAEVAGAAAAKVGGIELPEQQLEAAVDAVMAERSPARSG